MLRSLAIVVMLLLSLAYAPVAVAQEASPEASPMAMSCDAPELPPGTPTPMEEAPPASEDEPPAEPAASPVDEEAPPASEEGSAGDEMPAGQPASDEEAAAVEMAAVNLFGCLNSGDYLKIAALMTDNFIQNFLGVPTPYDVESSFEGFQPVEVISTSNPQVYADGSASIDVVFSGLFNGPGGVGSARWTFVEEDGVWKLDNYLDVPLPEGTLPDAVIIDVQMVDFAFALSQSTVPANTPVIFRTSNASAAGEPHVNVVVTFGEGTTPQQVITGEIDPFEASIGFFGAIFLEPGGTGDLAFTGLEPGTYFLVCDVETADGTPHYELGMVAQITVE